MTVTQASKLLGVSRPTLSKLLNGNASLSPEMAGRLEKTFGTPRSVLLQMQADYDQGQAQAATVSPKTVPYVPPYLDIRARDISAWARRMEARSRLAVLLRTLVNSTAAGLSAADFPGNDDAERPGWDGRVSAGAATPWVPEGESGWEFGCNKGVKAKADSDYKKSVDGVPRKERLELTFVFVTPHAWPGKKDWAAARSKEGNWKGIRAYDASDLEQWISQSLPAQAWFANEADIPSEGVRSLDRCWSDWADVADPPLPAGLFESAVGMNKEALLKRLQRHPPEPTMMAADSFEEATAFLAQLLGPMGGDELATLRDRVLVFDRPGALRKLANSSRPFIPVIYTREVEKEWGPNAKTFPSILIYPRNAHVEPHVELQPITHEALSAGLAQTGRSESDINALAEASGRSLTILRRRLAIAPSIQRPDWAEDSTRATRLVPCMLLGAWNTANAADLEALAALGQHDAEEMERNCQMFARMNDAPIWSVGTYRGVVSKIDALFAVAERVTAQDLKRYFSLANLVLGEDDPSLDLPEEERWLAGVRGKTRKFSKALRDGISETLVLLCLHSKLFEARGLDPVADACRLFDSIFPKPPTTRRLEASNDELPTYAEALPTRFLELLEDDLKQPEPAAYGLLKPVDSGVFGAGPRRTGLLWALEALAWNPRYLPRVVMILAQLSQVRIEDNWTNKPEASLRAIFRSWMPQTAADQQARVQLVKRLQLRFSEVAWRLSLANIGREQEAVTGSHRPRWRSDGYGHGKPVATWGPVLSFESEMLELVLCWNTYTPSMLCDLIEKLPSVPEQFQARIWTLLESWGRDHASDREKADIVEKIRVTTRSVAAMRRAEKQSSRRALAQVAKRAMAALAPADPIHRHLWLFLNPWVQESADEIEDEDHDYESREARVRARRLEALREILDERGEDGLLAIVEQGKTPWLIGALAAELFESNEALEPLLRSAWRRLHDPSREWAIKQFVGGAIRRTYDDPSRRGLITDLIRECDDDQAVDLLLVAPFQRPTWALVQTLGEDAHRRYWLHAVPEHTREYTDDVAEGARALLAAQRPRAAFAYLHLHFKSVDPQFLASLLSAVVSPGNDAKGEYPLEPYDIERAFKRIGASPALTLVEKASLEFQFIEALAGVGDREREVGIPHLERYVEAHPEFFVQAIVWRYKRDDRGEDPVEYQIPPGQDSHFAERSYRLLDALRRIPGHDAHGALSVADLLHWVTAVRSQCAALSRGDHADREIGELLSHASDGNDGVWPCEVVREAMEQIQSPTLMEGAVVGRLNSRGPVWRGTGGEQERELAEKYRRAAAALEVSHPFVASELLLAIADSYEWRGKKEDVRAHVRRRLG